MTRGDAIAVRIDRWIRRELARVPLKAKSLVVTVWGDAIAPHGGAVWLSGLIRLLAPLGLNERLVRTSVYRLVQEGWLATHQDGRRSLYRLTAGGLRRFEHAYRRIYAPPAWDWNGDWDVVLSPAAGLSPRERRELRRELGWEGFGAIAPAVFVRPVRPGSRAALSEIVRSLGLERRVALLVARDTQGSVARSLQALAADCWHLAALTAEYRRFITRFGPVLESFRACADLDPERCFVVRTLLIHAFRRVTLHDPQLPDELLPGGWPEPTAYALCRDFYRLTHKAAERHLAATLETRDGRLPPAEPYFYSRFGGL
jgi:phenylacetic acid degradation operon negative regulatory protein